MTEGPNKRLLKNWKKTGFDYNKFKENAIKTGDPLMLESLKYYEKGKDVPVELFLKIMERMKEIVRGLPPEEQNGLREILGDRVKFSGEKTGLNKK